jgi:biopolymer transport protein TolR
MAMGSGGSGTGLSSDINVTPMIDVLLVLLIIFMITLPLSRRAFDVQVPAEQRDQPKTKSQSDQIVLELRPDGTYAVNNVPVTLPGLDAKLHEVFDQRPVKLMFVKAAPNRKYREVVEAMDIARGAGVQVIGFTPADKAASH